nr:hypothetical protein Itr_chr04CG13800 [Ipomoea trifida]
MAVFCIAKVIWAGLRSGHIPPHYMHGTVLCKYILRVEIKSLFSSDSPSFDSSPGCLSQLRLQRLPCIWIQSLFSSDEEREDEDDDSDGATIFLSVSFSFSSDSSKTFRWWRAERIRRRRGREEALRRRRRRRGEGVHGGYEAVAQISRANSFNISSLTGRPTASQCILLPS